MNAPTPTPSGSQGEIPPPPPATLAQNTMPTLGSIVGSAGGAALAASIHVTDPVAVGSIVTGVTALVTALFHFLGGKFGVRL